MILMAVVTTVVFAVPAKRGNWKTLKLADNIEVKAMLVGDEFGHYWVDEKGLTYVQTDDIDIYKQTAVTELNKRASEKRNLVNQKRAKRLPRKSNRVSSYFGKKKGIIILVNFTDVKFQQSNTLSLFKRIANEENFVYGSGSFKGSMHDYFKAQSLGKFELDFDVFGPVTVSQSSSYYGSNNSDDEDKYPAEMVIEAVNLIKNEVTDWYQYDWDDDGLVDQVYVVYAGKGEADGGDESTIWPHAYDLYSANYYGDGSGPVTVANNLQVNTYACGSELNGSNKIEGIGTMCHEFSHCLGYPDFYDIDYSGGIGMDSWDLMDQGSYNDNGYLPAGYTSYERWVAGWETPVELSDEDVVVDSMKALQDSGESYIIYNKGNKNEYFLLENRQLKGWDAGVPGAGLLILHVDYDEEVWASNGPNDDPDHQRMTWIPADNKYQKKSYMGQSYLAWEGMTTDVFPYGEVTSFNRDTKPAAKFINKSGNTYYMDSSVEEIKQNADGTISFKFVAKYETNNGGDDDIPSPEGNVFYESFNQCNGSGGNDDKWGSSIASSSFSPDIAGWSSSAMYGGNKCARFGKSKVQGVVTTPEIVLTENTHTLTFKAASFGNDGTKLKVSSNNTTSVTIEPSEFTMKNDEWTVCTATITGNGTIKLKFTPEMRFLLDEVMVKPVETNSLKTVDYNKNTKVGYYTLDGRFAGYNLHQLGHGLYIHQGRKIVK